MDIIAQTDLFFSGRPQEWTIFEALKRALTAAWPQTQLRVMKSCISFDDPKPYCYVSHPPRKGMRGLLVTFGLREPVAHPRFFRVVPISANRFTVHVLVQSAQEIDAELIGFLAQARR